LLIFTFCKHLERAASDSYHHKRAKRFSKPLFNTDNFCHAQKNFKNIYKVKAFSLMTNCYNTIKKWLIKPIFSALFVCTTVFLICFFIQSKGYLQANELHTFDKLLSNRPESDIDSRVVIIGEMESDIARYGHPLSDQIFTNTIQKLENEKVRVIGIDKYRDKPVAPGTKALKKILNQYENIVWIFFTGNNKKDKISAPAALNNNPERLGFNDMLEDSDGVIRRGLLFLDFEDNLYYSFPLLISLHYLAAENIAAQSDEQGNLNLNGISLPKLSANFGGYKNVDTNAYQIMLDYPGLPNSFPFFSLSDLLDNKIPTEALRDKIVLIGGTASSLGDYKMLPGEIRRFGVENHAFIISQLLKFALEQKKPLQSFSDIQQSLWLFLWCFIGAITGGRRNRLWRTILFVSIEIGILLTSSQFLLNAGWWLTLICPLMGFSSAFVLNLAFTFARERKKRGQLMQMFSKHVSPEVANQLWQHREQFFSEGGVRPDSLTATVLFTDIVGFTSVSEDMKPIVLMNWLNIYMEEMTRIVMNHHGVVNKYIGDAIMAIFGVPIKREMPEDIAKDADLAIQCALEFNKRLRELNLEWAKKGLPTVMMRTGIYTGDLVAGSFGGILRMEYTVIGDTVNIASRLESFDKETEKPTFENPCRILIGQSTWDYVQTNYQTKWVGEFQLKGKNNSLNIYKVIDNKFSITNQE
jgi:adenylate cyclase